MKKRDRMAAIRHAAVLKRLDRIERRVEDIQMGLGLMHMRHVVEEAVARPPDPSLAAVLRKNRPN